MTCGPWVSAATQKNTSKAGYVSWHIKKANHCIPFQADTDPPWLALRRDVWTKPGERSGTMTSHLKGERPNRCDRCIVPAYFTFYGNVRHLHTSLFTIARKFRWKMLQTSNRPLGVSLQCVCQCVCMCLCGGVCIVPVLACKFETLTGTFFHNISMIIG